MKNKNRINYFNAIDLLKHFVLPVPNVFIVKQNNGLNSESLLAIPDLFREYVSAEDWNQFDLMCSNFRGELENPPFNYKILRDAFELTREPSQA